MAKRRVSTSSATADKFLNEVFLNLEHLPGQLIVTFALPARKPAFHEDAASAAEWAVEQARKHQNAYFGCCTLDHRPPKGRGRATDVGCLWGCWADVDYGRVHAKNVAPSEKAAHALLAQAPLPPTLVVHSGHGLQPWWLLTEPQVLHDGKARTEAAMLTTGVVKWLQAHSDYEVDPVGDLPRVLRVPGTINWKRPQSLKPVRVTPLRDLRRYSVDELSKAFEITYEAPAASAPSVPGDLMPNPAAPVNVSVFCTNDPEFSKVWSKERKFPSPSEYDLSIASRLARVGCSDQEIANVIHTWHTSHGEDTSKLFRKPSADGSTYLSRTISKARVGSEREQATERIEELTFNKDKAKALPPEKAFEVISKRLGFTVCNLIQHGREDPTYNLVIEKDGKHEEILLGDSDAVLEYRKFQRKVLGHVALIAPAMKTDEWHNLIQLALTHVTFVPREEEERRKFLDIILDDYLRGTTVCEGSEYVTAMDGNQPFRRDGQLAVHAGDLLRHVIARNHDRNMTRKKLTDMLRHFGFRSKDFSGRVSGEMVHRYYWIGEYSSNGKE